MASYYGFVERDASNFVNYAEVGRNFVNVLEEEGKRREELKTAIDENTRELNNRLLNLPQGESKTINEWMLQFGNVGSEAMRAQEKALKSGKLKYKDYIQQRQNLIDGTTSMINTIKTVNERYSETLERVKKGEAQPVELKVWEQVEGFGDFSKTTSYVRPDGKVIIGWADKAKYDGKDIMTLSNDPNYFTEINALNARINQKFDTWDVKGTMDAMVDEMGLEINSLVETKNGLGATGTIREVLDITKRENLPKDLQGVVMKFEEAETKKLESYLTNPLNVSSVLTQRLLKAPNGQPYEITFDPKARDANPNLILMKTNGDGSAMPDFSGPVGAQQQKEALEFLRLEARLRYDKKSELTTTPQIQLQERRPLSEGERSDRDKNEFALNFARQTSYLLSGTPEQAKAAVGYFRGQGVPLELNPPGKNAGVYIRNEANELVPFEMKGTPTKLGTSIVGALIRSSGAAKDMGINDTQVVRHFGKFMGNNFQTSVSESGVVVERDLQGEFRSKMDQTFNDDMFNNKDNAQTAAVISNALKGIPGVKIKPATMTDDIKITVPNPVAGGEPLTIEVNSDSDSPEEATIERNKLISFLEGLNLPKKVLENILGPEKANNKKVPQNFRK